MTWWLKSHLTAEALWVLLHINEMDNVTLRQFVCCRCDGEEFNSSEQYIQWKKAAFFKDHLTMTRIINCEDAMDSKETSRDINNFDRKAWNNVAEELCYEGVRQKFLQNQHLLDELLRTGNKTLVESSYDDVWGTGVPLSNRNCLIKEQWKSIGILGNILMSVRESARNIDTPKPDNTESTAAH